MVAYEFNFRELSLVLVYLLVSFPVNETCQCPHPQVQFPTSPPEKFVLFHRCLLLSFLLFLILPNNFSLSIVFDLLIHRHSSLSSSINLEVVRSIM